ncbi:MAG: hypothetical protein ACK5U2_03175, partial [Microcystis sp.]
MSLSAVSQNIFASSLSHCFSRGDRDNRDLIGVDILTAVKRTAIPKPHDLGFCFFPLRGSAPALTDLLCSGLMVALQTDTASPAA